MPVENANGTIQGLDKSWPLTGDPKSEGDNHIRQVKEVLKSIFPGVGGTGFAIPITTTEAELNALAGVVLVRGLPLAAGRALYVNAGTPPTEDGDEYGGVTLAYQSQGVVQFTLPAPASSDNSLNFQVTGEGLLSPIVVDCIQQTDTTFTVSFWRYNVTTFEWALIDSDLQFRWQVWDRGAT
jgi:hypothetical protein